MEQRFDYRVDSRSMFLCYPIQGGMTMNNNVPRAASPVKVIRDEVDASVAASIWLRETKAGYFFDVTVSRAYSKAENEIGYSQTFGGKNIDALCRVLTQCKYWIDEQRQRAVVSSAAEARQAPVHPRSPLA
jgi:hypothetical protein